MAAGLRLQIIPIRLNINRPIFAIIILYLFEAFHSLHTKALES